MSNPPPLTFWAQRLIHRLRLKPSHSLAGVGALSSLVALAWLLSSCGTVSPAFVAPPAIEGATFVGNQACAECHNNICRLFPASAHARIHAEGLKLPGSSGCESCHGAGSRHIAAGGGRGKFIVNPAKDAAACFRCHMEIQAAFNLPQHHPVLEGRMNCVQCHDPHGLDIKKPASGLAMARGNQTCATCHREQTRPKVFEHEAVREGCTVCHSPHGSVSAKMLVERDINLCLKCHAEVQGASAGAGEIYIGKVPHSVMIRQGTCWSAGCHTAVHGSNMSRQLLY